MTGRVRLATGYVGIDVSAALDVHTESTNAQRRNKNIQHDKENRCCQEYQIRRLAQQSRKTAITSSVLS